MVGTELDDEPSRILYIPEGCGHGGAACSILGLSRATRVSGVRRFDRRACRQTRRVGDMSERSAKSMKPARISFYGNFGAGNLGNECTLQAVIEQILRRWPNAQLLCFCTNPQDVRTRHNIAAFPSEAFDKGTMNRSGSRGPRGRLARIFRIAFQRIPFELVHWVKSLRAVSHTDM